MYQLAKPLFFRTETPLHAGSGSDLGHIDLPIQREKHTDLPNIQSSSLKGAFRQNLEQNVTTNEDKIGVHLAFGYDGDSVDKASEVGKFFKIPKITTTQAHWLLPMPVCCYSLSNHSRVCMPWQHVR